MSSSFYFNLGIEEFITFLESAFDKQSVIDFLFLKSLGEHRPILLFLVSTCRVFSFNVVFN